MKNNCNRTKLFRFLKERNIFKPFIEAFYDEYQINTRVEWCDTSHKFNGHVPASIYDYCHKINCIEEIINYAFEWEKTAQGYDFWSRVNREWKYYCNSN